MRFARGSALGVLCACVGSLLGAVCPAFAAAPEPPETLEPSVTNTTAEFLGIVNPAALSTVSWFFQYAVGSSCEAPDASVTPTNGPEEVQARFAFAPLAGLQHGTQYTVCLVAENEAKELTLGNEVSFTTTSVRPTVTAESASNLGSTEATVTADINPEGAFTGYRVQYVSDDQFKEDGFANSTEVPAPPSAEVSVGSPVGAVHVLAQLTGLAQLTDYHFRFVATNGLGATSGSGAQFTTLSSVGGSASTLPDERFYELVSNLGSAEAYAPPEPAYLDQDFRTALHFQAALNGDAVAYIAESAPSGGHGGTGNGEGNQWLARRSSEGWDPSDISQPSPIPGGQGEYESFSSDLSTGVLQDASQPPLTGDAPPNCAVLYSRATGSGAVHALFTATKTMGNCGGPHFAGSSADGSHVVFQSEAALTDQAEEAEPPEVHQGSHSFLGGAEGNPCQLSCNLYDSADGQLRLVNLLPGTDQAVPNATFGGASQGPPDFSNVISEDGSHVFWTDTQPGPDLEHVYLRLNASQPPSPLDSNGECIVAADACTISVSVGAARYWTATPDGRYAFYTEGGQLWRFDSKDLMRTAVISEDLNQQNAGVQGVIGINQTGEDGAYVYIVATGVLASNENRNGDSAEEGSDNLYMLHDGDTSFIATLASNDNELTAESVSRGEGMNYGDWQPSLGSRTAEVTPDGRHVVFESIQQITGYNNVDVANQTAVVEVFVYSADTGVTVCASCNPNGAAPEIKEGESEKLTLLPVSVSDAGMRRWISEDGDRVFFDSFQALTARDTNGVRDVYEWEREGTASCPATAPARRNGGCTFVLSSGESADYSFLIDADANGDNVFLTTRAPLLPEDHDEDVDLYDVRVHGGFPHTALGCTGTGCQGVPPAPPSSATPASATFSGLGNFPSSVGARPLVKPSRAQLLAKALAVCRRGGRSRRGRHRRSDCERRAKKRYGAVKRKPKRSGHGTKRKSR